MNIFIFSQDLQKSAEYFFKKDPKRANKQIVELCQMLAYAVPFRLPKKNGGYYCTTNLSHKNHPATRWTSLNRLVALKYLGYLIDKFQLINSKVHACNIAYEEMLFNLIVEIGFNFSLKRVKKCKFQWHSKQPQPHKNIYKAYKLYLEKKQKREIK